eukprot:TRINITY_DN2188_c0_g1_i2.p1 TRINITY_DN2188_c0_g1~~TRINITY_DN2188_c0_g1_i2.p1  ORF type:complete len:346 (-),score=85.60 TRINITY_DN2188_c0_g1_i2:133-1044(-)
MTWAQLLIALVFVVLGGILSPMYPSFFGIFAPLEWDWNVAQNVAPLSLVYIAMIALNNICLRYVEVTFYQVARSLTLLWTLAFSYFTMDDPGIDQATVSACLVIFSGFVVGSVGEVNFSWAGLIAGAASSACVAYYGIAIKKALPHVGGSHWRLLIYNTPIAIVFFVPVLIVFDELPGLSSIPITPEVRQALIISGVLGFLINIAIFMQVRYTTALTNAISGTAKACVQTLLGYMYFGNEVSQLNFVGIVAVIAGSGWYSRIKYMKMEAQKIADEKNTLDVEAGLAQQNKAEPVPVKVVEDSE